MLNSIIMQIPHGTPNPDNNNPVDFTNPFDLLVFLILPIVLVVFYIIWRRKRNKRK